MTVANNTISYAALGTASLAYVALFGPDAEAATQAGEASSDIYISPRSSGDFSPASFIPSNATSGQGALERAAREIDLHREMATLASEFEGLGDYLPKRIIPEKRADKDEFNHGDLVWLTKPVIVPPFVAQWGLYAVVGGSIVNLDRRAPLTEALQGCLAHVFDLQKEAVEALKPGLGWKLHLNFDYAHRGIVSQIEAVLRKLVGHRLITTFKIGRGGGVESGQPGKEATVYIGHGYRARRVAEFLHRNCSHLLLPPVGDTLVDDILFTTMIAARFDVTHSYCNDILQYGKHGVPFVKGDRRFYEKNNGEDARKFAYSLLAARFGDFFTDGFKNAVRPRIDK